MAAPSTNPVDDALAKPFDYIIAGGGTAGLVLAARLSEDSDVRVLVIEAGGDRRADPLVLCPGLVAGVYGKDEYDWNFASVPQVSPSFFSLCALHSRTHSSVQLPVSCTPRCFIPAGQHLVGTRG